MSRYAAIVLAAGRGARFKAAGGREATKLVAPHDGVPLVRHVARAALMSTAEPAIVVTGHARDAVEAALDGLDVWLVHNAAFAEGLSSSLRCGLAAVPQDAPGAVILLGDMPEVASGTIDALICRAEEAPTIDAAVSVHKGVAGNPVLLRRSLFSRLTALAGDEGARRLLKEPGVAVAEVEQPASILMDVDRPEDLGPPERTGQPRRDDGGGPPAAAQGRRGSTI